MTEELTLKQKRFCEIYTSEGDTFGNATLSYALAYGFDLDSLDKTPRINEEGKPKQSLYDEEYHKCGVMAHNNLRKEKLREYINALLVSKLNDTTVDAQLTKLLLNSRKDDVKLNSIKVYNDLKQRIVKKIDITTANRPLVGLSDEELKNMLNDN